MVITRVEPTVQNRTDLNKLRNANWLKNAHRDLYDRVTAFPWVQDSLSQKEGQTVENLFYIAAGRSSNLKALLDLDWLEDDLTAPEAKAVRWLRALNHLNEGQTATLLEMPFLKSVTETDALLIKGMFSRQYRRAPGNILDHPKAKDGIDDDDTILITAATTSRDENQIRRLLTPGGATVETWQIATPRTPNLNLSIVRAGSRRATDTSFIVEDAIAYVEDTMDMPLPTNHVILLLDDSGVFANFAGVNYGQAMAIRRKGEDGSDRDRQAFVQVMVHEVAHYFWHGNEDWIDEGVANAIDITYAIDKNLPSEFKTNHRGTCNLSTLQDLAGAEHHRNSLNFLCNYFLGGSLFLDLQDTHGKQEFRQGLKNLYAMTQKLHTEQEQAGIEEVKRAFGENNPVVIKHWTGEAPTTVTVQRIESTKGTPQPTPTTASVARTQPTPTPANLVVTRINTPSAGATSTPSPPLRATNTPRPRPTPTPTPTPVPTATPTPEFLSHRNAEPDEYTILYPHGWNPSHSGSTARFTSPDGSANLEIQAHAVSSDASLAGFVDQYRDEWLTQVRTWHDYVATSTTGEFRGAINFVEIRFRRQISPDSCVEDGITHLYRSRYFPARMTGYSVTMTVCQEDLATMEQKRNTVMESFKEE